MDDFELENWMPMSPEMGPPLPRSVGIYWPWYKPAIPEVVRLPPAVPVAAPPIVVAPPAAPVIAYPPPPPVAPPVIAYPPPAAPPVIAYPPYPPAPPPPEVPPVPEKYRLFVSVVGKGAVSPKEGEYLTGTPVPLIATPAPGYEFDYWSGDVSGTNPVVIIMMDRAKTAIAHFKELPPPELPPPKLPTVSILSATFTPSEATVGDVVGGTISWRPTIAGSPEVFDFRISADLIDSAGRQVMNVFTASPTGEIGMPQATPFSLDTRGLPEGWYGLQVHFSDLATGVEIAKRRFANLLHLLPLPEIPPPPPPVPEVPAMSPEEVLEDYREFALEVNRDLGGSYSIAPGVGELIPPPDWPGSVWEWSSHVQIEAAKRYLFWPEKFGLLPFSIRALVLA